MKFELRSGGVPELSVLAEAVHAENWPQLGVNNDSVQVRLYCFWPKAFCRNNFVTCCQGSFCPQLRQKNKEQTWEFLYLILISSKCPGRAAGVAHLAGVDSWKSVSTSPLPGCHACSMLSPHWASVLHVGQAHCHHRAFAPAFSSA